MTPRTSLCLEPEVCMSCLKARRAVDNNSGGDQVFSLRGTFVIDDGWSLFKNLVKSRTASRAKVHFTSLLYVSQTF